MPGNNLWRADGEVRTRNVRGATPYDACLTVWPVESKANPKVKHNGEAWRWKAVCGQRYLHGFAETCGDAKKFATICGDFLVKLTDDLFAKGLD